MRSRASSPAIITVDPGRSGHPSTAQFDGPTSSTAEYAIRPTGWLPRLVARQQEGQPGVLDLYAALELAAEHVPPSLVAMSRGHPGVPLAPGRTRAACAARDNRPPSIPGDCGFRSTPAERSHVSPAPHVHLVEATGTRSSGNAPAADLETHGARRLRRITVSKEQHHDYDS